jgi:glyoxylase-like metal-dependent hydrolase (beta-lactamase superfamily II)
MLPIVRVLAPNPGLYTLEGTNTWVVGTDPSVVIDPGPLIPEHQDEVARAAGRVGAVLVTHDHPDHAPGASTFARRVGAPLRAYRLEDAEHMRDGELVQVGVVALRAYHTPGHSSDHLAFLLVSERALFTGDAVVGRGTTFIDPPDGDLAQYLRSLVRLQELGARTLYPGHGPTVLHGAEKFREYLDHRAQREEQVLAAMADGPRTITSMVREMYADRSADVHELAARSVLAHLLKLQGEGRADRRGSGPDATWFAVTPKACARCGRPVTGRARFCASCSLIILQEGAATATETE